MHDTEPARSNQAATGLSVNDAAEMLGVSPTTVRAHLRQGTLAGERVGGTWVVYLAGQPVQSAPSSPPEPESIAASERSAPSSSRPVTILARLVVLLRRVSPYLQELRARGQRA